MAHLNAHTVLQRTPSLSVHITSRTIIDIEIEGRRISCSPHALAVLDAFSHPAPLSRAIDALTARVLGAQDWMDFMSTIVQLYEAGVLVDEQHTGPGAVAARSASAQPHVAMLNNKARTSGFLSGITAVVRPGDVVVDIGTGTGILAIAAARAGADHVYAIEATEIAGAAQAMFQANGLADRITLLQGWSTQIELPQRADVLVSEIIGDDPLAENVLEIMADAHKRLLTPDARVIPNRLRVFGLPMMLENAELEKHTFATGALKKWRDWYDMDFDSLGAALTSPVVFYVEPQSARHWQPLADSVLLADVSLNPVTQTVIDTSVVVTAKASGRVNALLVYFELEVSPNVRLSTAPDEAAETNHWKVPVWSVGNALPVRSGDTFNVSYRYRVGGGRNTVTIAPFYRTPSHAE